MTEEDIATILKEALYEFPVREANVALPTWITVLDNKHWLRVKLEEAVAEGVKLVRRLRDIDGLILELSLCDAVQEVLLQNMDLAKGVASVEVTAPEHLYYDALSEAAGQEIKGQDTILRLMRSLTQSNREFDRIRDAFRDARNQGYGIAPPSLEEMSLDQPDIIRQGHRIINEGSGGLIAIIL